MAGRGHEKEHIVIELRFRLEIGKVQRLVIYYEHPGFTFDLRERPVHSNVFVWKDGQKRGETPGMRSSNINQALNALIDLKKAEQAHSDQPAMGRLTAEGAEELVVDISGIRVMNGLNILAESLINGLIEQSVYGHGDVSAEQRVDPDIQSELHAAGIRNVTFSVRLTVAESLPAFNAVVGFQVRYMLNAIQNDDIYRELFPPPGRAPRGVLFPFHREDHSDVTRFFYLIEHVPAGRFLRITMESTGDSRLRLSRIPHITVEHIDLVHTRVDIPGAALRVAQGVMEACLAQKCAYIAGSAHFEDYVRFLRKAGLDELEALSFTWPAGFLKAAPVLGLARLNMRVSRILYVPGMSGIVT